MNAGDAQDLIERDSHYDAILKMAARYLYCRDMGTTVAHAFRDNPPFTTCESVDAEVDRVMRQHRCVKKYLAEAAKL